MSGDQLATSFGDPNAQPPTPRQTPNSPAFPSPVFQTPRQTEGQFDDTGGWTPRFAEEYSVFNATPGNLRGSQGPFVDFDPATPYPPSAGLKRPLSAEGVAAQIATHVTHFSPNPSFPQHPVDPSQCLQSSPSSLATAFEHPATGEAHSPLQARSLKKVRRGTVIKDAQGQTATPPPSGRKGERKLAPKINADAMQNDHGFPQPDFTAGTPQQHNMAGMFVTTPTDMFGYPMSAPATAPAFTNARPFWDDPSMAGMDIDFSAAAPDIFQTPTPSHRPMGSLDWGRTNQVFQETGAVPQPGQENVPQQKRERPIAPKTMMPPAIDTTAPDPSMFAGTYPTPIDDPFAMVAPGAGVNPGLLFSGPPSSGIETTAFNPVAHPPSSSAPAAPQTTQTPQAGLAISKAPLRSELRRSLSVKEMGTGKLQDRMAASSPVKRTGRPGLSRSLSESRGKRPVGRPALPSLAPAGPRVTSQSASSTGLGTNRPILQSNRPAGRISPSKGHHQRLSSLTSIPEAAGPRTRTSVKFTIDANGRARAEPTLVEEEPLPVTQRRHSARLPLSKSNHQRWDSSEDESSSTDDEPIIIPSRNTSFVLPDPIKPSRPHPFHSSQRSLSDKSSSSTYATTFAGGAGGGSPVDGDDSEAETVMNEQAQSLALPPGKVSGDAASELQKLVETRHKRPGNNEGGRRRVTLPSASAGGGGGGGFGGQYAGSSSNTMSPTTLTDGSLPTPSTDPRSMGQGVRCVCNRSDAEGDDFLVQCESCEMWLHGNCINIAGKRALPRVYICAFCANTPNVRGGRQRTDIGSGAGAMGPPSTMAATSPLAHKSFRSFR